MDIFAIFREIGVRNRDECKSLMRGLNKALASVYRECMAFDVEEGGIVDGCFVMEIEDSNYLFNFKFKHSSEYHKTSYEITSYEYISFQYYLAMNALSGLDSSVLFEDVKLPPKYCPN